MLTNADSGWAVTIPGLIFTYHSQKLNAVSLVIWMKLCTVKVIVSENNVSKEELGALQDQTRNCKKCQHIFWKSFSPSFFSFLNMQFKFTISYIMRQSIMHLLWPQQILLKNTVQTSSKPSILIINREQTKSKPQINFPFTFSSKDSTLCALRATALKHHTKICISGHSINQT